MKIRIPSTVLDESVPGYLSKRKEYLVLNDPGLEPAIITDDEGDEVIVNIINGSSHIGGHAWEVLSED